MPVKKKVVIIGTGGTIAMKRGPDGALVPYQTVKRMVKDIPELKELSKKYEIETIDLMNADSSDRDPAEWKLIGEKVVESINRNDIEGVVITHGTDTMAYTAQYLDYSIKNLRKPVVLTGGQIAATEPNSDGISNLKDAITVAAEGNFAEVLVCCRGKNSTAVIWKAENAVKSDVWKPDAFRSVGHKPVASVRNGKIETNKLDAYDEKYDMASARGILLGNEMWVPTEAWLEEELFDFEGIEEVIARPSMNLEKLMKIAKSKETKAIMINGFGAGHIAERYHPFIEEATKRGKLVVMCSQAEGPVDLLEYGLGRKALEKGALPVGDRTPQEVYMRLAHVLGIMKRGKETVLGNKLLRGLLKDNKLGFTLKELDDYFFSKGKYLFLSNTKFQRRDDDTKYEPRLGMKIADADLLRFFDAKLGMSYDVIKKKLSKKIKNFDVDRIFEAGSWSGKDGFTNSLDILLKKYEKDGKTEKSKHLEYKYCLKTKKYSIEETSSKSVDGYLPEKVTKRTYDFDPDSGKRRLTKVEIYGFDEKDRYRSISVEKCGVDANAKGRSINVKTTKR